MSGCRSSPARTALWRSPWLIMILVNGLWSKEFCGDFKDGKNRFERATVKEADFAEKHTNGLVKWWNFELKDRTPEWAADTGLRQEQIDTRCHPDLPRRLPTAPSGTAPYMSPRGPMPSLPSMPSTAWLVPPIAKADCAQAWVVLQVAYPKIDDFQDDLAKAGTKNQKIDQRGYLEHAGHGKSQTRAAGLSPTMSPTPFWPKTPMTSRSPSAISVTSTSPVTEGRRWDQAMAQIPFFVHCVPMFSEMTYFADIVLPSALHHSRKTGPVSAARPISTVILQFSNRSSSDVRHQRDRNGGHLAVGRKIARQRVPQHVSMGEILQGSRNRQGTDQQ
jgi:hypothetical protein